MRSESDLLRTVRLLLSRGRGAFLETLRGSYEEPRSTWHSFREPLLLPDDTLLRRRRAFCKWGLAVIDLFTEVNLILDPRRVRDDWSRRVTKSAWLAALLAPGAAPEEQVTGALEMLAESYALGKSHRRQASHGTTLADRELSRRIAVLLETMCILEDPMSGGPFEEHLRSSSAVYEIMRVAAMYGVLKESARRARILFPRSSATRPPRPETLVALSFDTILTSIPRPQRRELIVGILTDFGWPTTRRRVTDSLLKSARRRRSKRGQSR